MLALLIGVHVKTLRAAARDGRLPVTYDTRTTFRQLRARATLAAVTQFRHAYYGRPVRPADRRDRPRSVTAVGQNIERLRYEIGFSYEELASSMGVERKTVQANASGRTRPRPQTLKLYADVFSDKLGRPVSVEEIRDTTDD